MHNAVVTRVKPTSCLPLAWRAKVWLFIVAAISVEGCGKGGMWGGSLPSSSKGANATAVTTFSKIAPGVDSGRFQGDRIAGPIQGSAAEGFRCENPGEPQSGIAPRIRRLNRKEYNNAVRDLLGDETSPANAFPSDPEVNGFTNNADALTISDDLADRYRKAAEAIAARAKGKLATLIPCSTQGKDEASCASEFITSWGERAWRRPLTGEESAHFRQLFTLASGTGGFAEGVSAVIQAMLQSPFFLFRTELGVPTRDAPGLLRLTDYEVASAISFLIAETTPDASLLSLAREGKLSSKAQVLEAAENFMGAQKAAFSGSIRTFIREWLAIDDIAAVEKDAQTYPDFNAQISNEMSMETNHFIDDAVWGPDGSLRWMLSGRRTFLTPRLAQFYGLPTPAANASSFTMVDLAATEQPRAGILTQGSFLAKHGKANASAPTERGVFIGSSVLCLTIPPPPPEVNTELGKLDDSLTMRERLSAHASEPSCAACHKKIDPQGFVLEAFDGQGRHRTMDKGKVIDTSGTLSETDVNGPFSGPLDYLLKLSSSQQVERCFTVQTFRYGLGTTEGKGDECALEEMHARFSKSGLKIPEALRAVLASDSFLYRNPSASRE